MYFLPIIFLFVFVETLCPDNLNIQKAQYHNEIINVQLQAVAGRRTELRSYWDVDPDIFICDDVLSISRARSALRYWEKLGYSFGSIKKLSGAQCFVEYHSVQAIFIQYPTAQHDMTGKLALTNTTKITRSSKNVRADIYIQSFATTTKYVLEHEVGHALGWYHSTTKYHIMYPDIRMVGSSSNGVSYKIYKELTEKQFNYFLP